MKMQKFSIFVKNNLQIKYKQCCKGKDHCHYTGEYRGAAHSICTLKHSIPIEIAILFHMRFLNMRLPQSS